MLIQTEPVQQYLIGKIFKDSGIDIKTGKIEINLFGPLRLSVEKCDVLLDKSRYCIKASIVELTFDKKALFKGEFYPSKIRIIKPEIEINTPDNLNNFIKNYQGEKHNLLYKDRIETLQITKGRVVFKGHLTAELSDLSLKLWRLDDDSRTFGVKGTGVIDYKNHYSFFKSSGKININPADILNSHLKIDLETKNTPAVWTPWSKYIDMRSGFYDSILRIEGKLRDQLTAKGNLLFKNINFILTKNKRAHEYHINKLSCTLSTRVKDRVLHVDSLNAKTDAVNLDLNAIINLETLDSPRLKLAIKSDFMPVNAFREFYPFPTTKPWVKDNLFSLFESGNIKINTLVLDGSIEQFRHLKKNKNYSIIGMSFSGNNIKLSNQGIQIPFTDVSARVDIKNGDLTIPELRGRFGNSTIENASLLVKDMFEGLPYFKVYVDGDFDIEELISHKEMEVIQESVREKINNFLGISGRLKAETTIGYKKDWGTPRILDGDYNFTDLSYNREFLSLPLTFKDLKFHIHEQGDNEFNGNGFLGDMPFSSSGLFEIEENDLRLLKADTRARLDMNRLLSEIFEYEEFPFRFADRLPWEISMEQQKDMTRYSGRVDIQNLSMESDSLSINTSGNGKELLFDLMSHPDGRIILNMARAVFDDSRATLSGQFNTNTKKLETLKIESDSLALNDLDLHINDDNKALGGNLSGSINVHFLDDNTHDPIINGQIWGKNLSFNTELLPSPVQHLDFRLDLAGKKGFLDNCRISTGENIVNLMGNLHGWKTVKGDFLLTSDFIDLTDFIAGKFKPHKKETPDARFHPDINIKVNASRGIWRKLEFNHLIADLAFSGDRITVNNARADLEKGDLSIKGYSVHGNSPKIDISGDINLKEQPIDKLISDTGFGDRGIKGTLSVNASLKATGIPEEAFLKGMSGNLKNISITKGLHKNSRVFIKILDFLNIPDKFKKRPPEMREEGFYFESIQGDAVIEKGILKTDNFVMKSPAFNAVGSGKENLYEMTHNFRLLVQPIGTIDSIIKSIPIAGRIFVDGDETFFSFGYDITGPWSEPAMNIVPGENVKGLFGVLKRVILTPFNLIKNINNATKSSKKSEPEEKK
ncbi:AsmA-like C-terminal domain-containing protein [Thermodesulfobacteriota bacterium]